MSLKATLIWSRQLLRLDMGPDHPLKPVRLLNTVELLQAYGVFKRPDVSHEQAPVAHEREIATVHSREYVEAVRVLSAGGEIGGDPIAFGLGTRDNPIYPGVYEAAAIAVGGSLQAAALVADYKTDTAFNLTGGMHHAHEQEAAGFCYFNDCAIAIAAILHRTMHRMKIAYVDIDAHHGDGVEEAFYNTPDVLTISVHESGRYLFPGTGQVAEPGLGPGKGYSVNVPLSPYTDDEQYLWAFDEVVMPLLSAYQPDYLFTQLGADTHFSDPLAHLQLTVQGYEQVIKRLSTIPAKWIAMGGGGYHMHATARCWAAAFGIMCGSELPDELPQPVAAKYPESQGRLRDPETPQIEPRLHAAARRFNEGTVDEVKGLIFPIHGL